MLACEVCLKNEVVSGLTPLVYATPEPGPSCGVPDTLPVQIRGNSEANCAPPQVAQG
jgi:hypothetical protein